MKCYVSLACFLCVFVFVCSAPVFPAGGSFTASSSLQLGGSSSSGNGGGVNGLTNILSTIDLPGLLRGVNSFVKLVGVFCPPLSQVLDNVIQNVTSTAFRVFGSAILRGGGLGGGSGGAGGGQRVNVVLPTYPPDEEDEDDFSDESADGGDNAAPANFNAELLSRSGSGSTEASAAVMLSRIDNSEDSTTTVSSEDTETTTTERFSNGDEVSTLYTSPANEDSNLIAKRHVRVPREADVEDDQDGAESAPEPAEDLTGADDDQDRNKRYLPFGGSVESHGAGGGSGNFLFDIIRSTADRAARTVGTVYRMVAGTESLGWGLSATSESSHTVSAAPFAAVDYSPHTGPFAKLVAGSGATEESDEKANSPGGVVEVDVQKSHAGYSGEGIPGPITRLFVIANRGIANLVQDLILRLAATSEKLVNFKARLITSLI